MPGTPVTATSATTSAMSPLTAHDLRRARCAAATRTAKAQARSGPSSARAAAASAARSAAEPAR